MIHCVVKKYVCVWRKKSILVALPANTRPHPEHQLEQTSRWHESLDCGSKQTKTRITSTSSWVSLPLSAWSIAKSEPGWAGSCFKANPTLQGFTFCCKQRRKKFVCWLSISVRYASFSTLKNVVFPGRISVCCFLRFSLQFPSFLPWAQKYCAGEVHNAKVGTL